MILHRFEMGLFCDWGRYVAETFIFFYHFHDYVAHMYVRFTCGFATFTLYFISTSGTQIQTIVC